MKDKEIDYTGILAAAVEQAVNDIYDDTPPPAGCCWNCEKNRGGEYVRNGKLFCNRSCEENYRWAGL